MVIDSRSVKVVESRTRSHPHTRSFLAQALAQKLQAFEDELDKDSPFHEFLLCDPAEILLHRLTSLDSLSAERLSNLVSILLDYRLLDVAAATAGGKIICGQPDRLLIPHPQKMVS